jgi:hypothetical protein
MFAKNDDKFVSALTDPSDQQLDVLIAKYDLGRKGSFAILCLSFLTYMMLGLRDFKDVGPMSWVLWMAVANASMLYCDIIVKMLKVAKTNRLANSTSAAIAGS